MCLQGEDRPPTLDYPPQNKNNNIYLYQRR